MGNKSSKQDERKPLTYFNEVKAAQKQKKSSSHILTPLPGDSLPGSHAIPADKKIYHRINFKQVVGIFIGVMILVLIWYVIAGPGRPKLEQQLINLIPTATNTVPPVDPSHTPPSTTLQRQSATLIFTATVKPTNTSTTTPTSRPTSTLASTSTPSPTSLPATQTQTITPSPTPACWQAWDITLADVGKTLCVEGYVLKTIEKPDSFTVIVSNEKGALYWVSYDMVWSQAELLTCYQVTGPIMQLGSNPILLFGYGNIPQECR